ncbi:hypothetical protein D3C76_1126900 [compost metagenome]
MPADGDSLTGSGGRSAIGQVADQVVGGGDADGQVGSVGHFAKYRRLPQGGIEAEAVHADVFGITPMRLDIAHHVGGSQTTGQRRGLAAGKAR